MEDFLEIFEANDDNVKAQVSKNQEVKENTESHIKKAIDALINMIKSAINNIKGFFFGKKLDEKQKEMNAKLDAAKKKNPNVGKKQIIFAKKLLWKIQISDGCRGFQISEKH